MLFDAFPMISDFIASHKGEFSALLTAFFWTFSAIAFEFAGKKIGSLSVTIFRLMVAFILLSLYSWIVRGVIFPTDASVHNWIWLSLSGLVGFVLGDLCLFQAYVVVGARISMLIMALAPLIAAIFGWAWLGEVVTPKQAMAMVITFLGIAVVILRREDVNPNDVNGNGRRKVKFSYPAWGILLALGGAVGQGGGLVLSKYGMADYDVFSSVQIRAVAGLVGFSLIFTMFNRWGNLRKALQNSKAMGRLAIGAFFGPFMGVSASLWAVRFTTTGVASAIISIVPVLIIPFSILFMHEKFKPRDLVGAVIAITGVVVFFL